MKKPKKPVPESIKKAVETKTGKRWGLSEYLRWHKCDCEKWTLRALCGPHETLVDPNTLSTDEEVVAAILEVMTFEVVGYFEHRSELRPRLAKYMPRWRKVKMADETDVVAEHKCGRPPLGTGGNPKVFRKKPEIDYDAEPPY